MPLLATQAIDGPGMATNTAELWVGAYNGGLGPSDGVFDEAQMWDHARTQSQLDALPAPVTISHGGSPPPGGGTFACANRTDGALVTTHKNLGTTTTQQVLAGGANARYDFTGTDLTNTYNSSTNRSSPSYNIRHNGQTLNGACLFGGIVRNGYAASLGDSASRKYPEDDGGQILFRDANYSNVLVDSFRFDHNWDPIRFEKTGNFTGSNVRVVRCAFTRTFDDCIENDQGFGGMSAEFCLAECVVFWSDRAGHADASNKTALIESCLVWMRPSYSTQIHFQVFKLNGVSTKFNIRNSVFRVQQATAVGGSEADPFDNLKRFNKIANSENNRILWTGSGAYPWTVPQGFTLVTGSAALTEWNNRRAQWWADNPQVPRISGDPA